jgi:hypothetical protein
MPADRIHHRRAVYSSRLGLYFEKRRSIPIRPASLVQRFPDVVRFQQHWNVVERSLDDPLSKGVSDDLRDGILDLRRQHCFPYLVSTVR